VFLKVKKSNLSNFRDLIDECEDMDMLESAQLVLTDLLEINKIKNKLLTLEKNISLGKRAPFYFFASSLSEDEVVYAAEKVNGKIRRIRERMEKEKNK